MTYVVTEACIRCKYMDCVEVCPVDCFYEGENMLVIHPDECIDCGVCEPECPVDAIIPDSEPGRTVGRAEPGLRGGLAQHHPQKALSRRRRRVEGRPRQIREGIQPQARRQLTQSHGRKREEAGYAPRACVSCWFGQGFHGIVTAVRLTPSPPIPRS